MAFPEAGNTSFVGERTKETVTGVITRVYATGGDFTIRLSDGREAKFRLVDPNYQRSGASYRAYMSSLALQHKIGRQVEVDLEYHPAFGWTAFGRRKFRFTDTQKRIERRRMGRM